MNEIDYNKIAIEVYGSLREIRQDIRATWDVLHNEMKIEVALRNAYNAGRNNGIEEAAKKANKDAGYHSEG